MHLQLLATVTTIASDTFDNATSLIEGVHILGFEDSRRDCQTWIFPACGFDFPNDCGIVQSPEDAFAVRPARKPLWMVAAIAEANNVTWPSEHETILDEYGGRFL
jgi:hypothetical protein